MNQEMNALDTNCALSSMKKSKVLPKKTQTPHPSAQKTIKLNESLVAILRNHQFLNLSKQPNKIEANHYENFDQRINRPTTNQTSQIKKLPETQSHIEKRR